MARYGFRSGSPKDDPIGFMGTTLGRAVLAEAKKATTELQAIQKEMSLSQAEQWLIANYPNLNYVTVRPMKSEFIRNRNTPFPNSEKEVVLG